MAEYLQRGFFLASEEMGATAGCRMKPVTVLWDERQLRPQLTPAMASRAVEAGELLPTAQPMRSEPDAKRGRIADPSLASRRARIAVIAEEWH